MLQLPHGCWCSDLSVSPKNWRNGGASLLTKTWRIQYYFKDPEHMDKYKYGKLVFVKGMNVYRTLPERRQATEKLLENELRLLKEDGYNPITKTFIPPGISDQSEIDPTTPFIKALTKSLARLTITQRTKIDMKSMITKLEKAARQLGIYNTSINSVTRRHLKTILDQCAINSIKFTNTRYNTYRGYLMMLFKELVELEAVPTNPLRDISKKPVTKKLKKVLIDNQRKKIDEHLAAVFPAFRNFVHLFFHSGGRMPELRQLKPSMVNLQKQTYRCIVKKRKQYTEVERTIKTIALPYWKYFLDNCPDDHFIFGPLLRPGMKPMGESMTSRYWQYYVKQDLGIDVGFYNLKHLNVTEVVDALDEQAAAELSAHTTTSMVAKVYDIRNKQRQHERLLGLKNKFA